MKWIQHHSNAGRDEVISGLRDRFGTEGYGVWWLIVETIAEQIHNDPRDSADYSLKKWREITGISVKKLQKILSFLEKHGKILVENSEKDGIVGLKIRMPKVLEIADEYTKKHLSKKEKPRKTPDKVPTKSGQTPEKVRLDYKIEEDKKKHNYKQLPILETPQQSKDLDHLIKIYIESNPEQPKLAGKNWVGWLGRTRDQFHAGLIVGMSQNFIEERIKKCSSAKPWEILPNKLVEEFKGKKGQKGPIERSDDYKKGALIDEEGKKRVKKLIKNLSRKMGGGKTNENS